MQSRWPVSSGRCWSGFVAMEVQVRYAPGQVLQMSDETKRMSECQQAQTSPIVSRVMLRRPVGLDWRCLVLGGSRWCTGLPEYRSQGQ